MEDVGGVEPADRDAAADLPADRVKDADRFRRDRGVVAVVVGVGVRESLSGVAAGRVAVQVALQLKGGVMGSPVEAPEEVGVDSIEGGMDS